MLSLLLAKDLRRAWRNPLPWLINLLVPLAMTALLGMVFGGKSSSGALGRIRFAVVDEDKSVLSDFLRGGANQSQGGKYLEPVFLEREEALRQINESKISAVLIIPTNFMRNYLTARTNVTLELIKNPAESIHPAVLEELLGAVATALSEVSRNFNSEFPDWMAVFEGKEDYHRVSLLIERAGDKIKAAGEFLNPPLVSYSKEDDADPSPDVSANSAGSGSSSTNGTIAKGAPAKSRASKDNGSSGVFAYLLVGLSAMFLLFLAGNAMADLHRELKKRTFERYQTMHARVWPFIAGKVAFAIVVLLICSGVMLVGGGLVFRIHWQQPIPLGLLTLGYVCFVSTLFAFLAALVPDERRAAVLNNIAGMALGLVGGCAFPAKQLPTFLRDHVTPWMPSNWFVEAARSLQFDSGNAAVGFALLKLGLISLILIGLATAMFRRQFRTGVRA